MYQRILLCTDGSEGATVAADAAIWLTQKLGGSLTALHIIDVRLLEGPLLSDLAGAMGAQPYSALLPQLQQIQKEKADAVLKAVVERSRERGVSCAPVSATGGLVRVLLEQEKNADLVVLGQRGEHAEWAWESLGSSVERMVRASVKTCLVCPPKFQGVSHLLLAYDGSDESLKAVGAALALAERFAARLSIVTAYERADQQSAAKIALEQAHLRAVEYKLPVELLLEHAPAEKAILETCRKLKADLIVMGAYGHTRVRELILGSTTTQVLRHANVPVLLARG